MLARVLFKDFIPHNNSQILSYETQPFNFVYGVNRCFPWNPYKSHKYSLDRIQKFGC